MDFFIENQLLREVSILRYEPYAECLKFVASDVTKDGPTFLGESVQRSRTTLDLFKKGMFKRETKSGTYGVFLCFEVQEMEAEEDDTPSPPAKTRPAVRRGKTPAMKKEPVFKKEKKEPAQKDKKGKGKQVEREEETSTVRKRAISQVSNIQQERSPRTERSVARSVEDTPTIEEDEITFWQSDYLESSQAPTSPVRESSAVQEATPVEFTIAYSTRSKKTNSN
jgi:hypothetical protein